LQDEIITYSAKYLRKAGKVPKGIHSEYRTPNTTERKTAKEKCFSKYAIAMLTAIQGDSSKTKLFAGSAIPNFREYFCNKHDRHSSSISKKSFLTQIILEK
jgi:hypothetical protein